MRGMGLLFGLALVSSVGCGARSDLDPFVSADGGAAPRRDTGRRPPGDSAPPVRDSRPPRPDAPWFDGGVDPGSCAQVGRTVLVEAVGESVAWPAMGAIGSQYIALYTVDVPPGGSPTLRVMSFGPGGAGTTLPRMIARGMGGTIATVPALGGHVVLFTNGSGELWQVALDAIGNISEPPRSTGWFGDVVRPAFVADAVVAGLAWNAADVDVVALVAPIAAMMEPAPLRLRGRDPWAVLSQLRPGTVRFTTIVSDPGAGIVVTHTVDGSAPRPFVREEGAWPVMGTVVAAQPIATPRDQGLVLVTSDGLFNLTDDMDMVFEFIPDFAPEAVAGAYSGGWTAAAIAGRRFGEFPEIAFQAMNRSCRAQMAIDISTSADGLRPALVAGDAPGTFLLLTGQSDGRAGRLILDTIQCAPCP